MRFGLRSLLGGIAVLGVGLYLLFAAPTRLATPALWVTAQALPALLTAGIVYGRGNLQAFCVGAVVPAFGLFAGLMSFCFWQMEFNPPPGSDVLLDFFDRFAAEMRVWTVITWGMSLFIGFLAVVARWYFVNRAPEDKLV